MNNLGTDLVIPATKRVEKSVVIIYSNFHLKEEKVVVRSLYLRLKSG
jgi:hypothetical protein